MKLKNSYILLIVMSIFLLVSVGSVCASDSASDVDVLADDFATGCPVHMFDQYVSIFREKALSVTILIQSESQLSSLYGSDKATTIINNFDTIVFLGSMDIDTGRSVSMRANRPLEDVLYKLFRKCKLY